MPGSPWRSDPRIRRRAEREELIERARTHAIALAERLPIVAAAVGGSVARGDFNQWSDVDLVVVAEDLPTHPIRRLELLDAGRPPLVELHGYTPAEFRRAVARGDPLATETAQRGVLLVGELPT